MPNEITQHGTGNFAFQDIHDSNFNIFIGKTAEYKDLLNQLDTQTDLLAFLPEDQTEKRLRVSQKIEELNAHIQQFKQSVLQLAAEFDRIEINTDRLRRAKEHFEKGEIAAARAVFDSEREQMQDENDRLIQQKVNYENNILPQLKQSSDEYFLRALLEHTAYDNENWLEDTCNYFERSIRAYSGAENICGYALFLQINNILSQSENLYQKYLQDFSSDSAFRAQALNNLASLHVNKNELVKAENEYKEALTIYRRLAVGNPDEHLPNRARTLNNLAKLHHDKNNLEKAQKGYEKALAIFRQLTVHNSSKGLADVATTLNNLANLHRDKNELEKAEQAYKVVLKIRHQLAEITPLAHLPDVAGTLNDMADLHCTKNELEKAKAEFEEALAINRQLAAVNPSACLPNVAQSLINMSIYYLDFLPERKHSIEYAIEAIMILLPIVDDIPYTQSYLQKAVAVLRQGWGLSTEEIQQMLDEK